MFASHGDTDFITGMRGLAAIGVVVAHTGGAGLISLLGQFGANLVALGPAGVFVFFVLSGFSVRSSWERGGGSPARSDLRAT